jgi:hypothetical protein
MSSRDQTEEKLERLVSQVLRDQPLRQAPASLEARVLGELAARARQPWWRRGIASWPASVRVPVIAGCAVCVPLVWVLSMWLLTHLVTETRSRVAGPLATLQGTRHTLASLGALATHILQSIPREWLVGGIIATATLYATLFALVAIGYSLLYPRLEYSKVHLT